MLEVGRLRRMPIARYLTQSDPPRCRTAPRADGQRRSGKPGAAPSGQGNDHLLVGVQPELYPCRIA